MAIFHCSIKIGSRGKGQSAIAASSYRSGNKMTDKETGITYDYTRKSGIVYSEISLCLNAPLEYTDRETLWNEVHKIEKSSNAQLWREIEIAVPQELNREEQIKAVRKYVKSFCQNGMCADWSLHDKGDGNPHAHIMLTMRSILENGKWAAKSRKVYDFDKNGNKIYQRTDKQGRKQYKSHKENYNDWNEKERAEEWRSAWANICNKYLSEEKKLDHRSYQRQELELEPTVHEGYIARKIERNGGISELCEQNRKIKERNDLKNKISEQLENIEKELSEIEKAKGAVINDRIGELLKRRATTVVKSERGITDGKRTVESGAEQQDTTNATTAIENLNTAIRESKIAVSNDDSNIRNRNAEEESRQRERNRAEEQRATERNNRSQGRGR